MIHPPKPPPVRRAAHAPASTASATACRARASTPHSRRAGWRARRRGSAHRAGVASFQCRDCFLDAEVPVRRWRSRRLVVASRSPASARSSSRRRRPSRSRPAAGAPPVDDDQTKVCGQRHRPVGQGGAVEQERARPAQQRGRGIHDAARHPHRPLLGPAAGLGERHRLELEPGGIAQREPDGDQHGGR